MNPEIPNQLRNKFVGLDIYLARHCNLRCRGCTRYSNIAKPKFYDARQLNADLLTMVSKGINLTRITLTGGEPLLHPDLITIIKGIRLITNNVVIDLFTNGKLFMEMKDELLPVLKRYYVEVLFSRYDSDIEYDQMVKACILLENLHAIVFHILMINQDILYGNTTTVLIHVLVYGTVKYFYVVDVH